VHVGVFGKVFQKLLVRSDRLFVDLVNFVCIDVFERSVYPAIFLVHHVIDSGPKLVVRLKKSCDTLKRIEVVFESIQKVLLSCELLFLPFKFFDFSMETSNGWHDTLVFTEIFPFVHFVKSLLESGNFLLKLFLLLVDKTFHFDALLGVQLISLVSIFVEFLRPGYHLVDILDALSIPLVCFLRGVHHDFLIIVLTE